MIIDQYTRIKSPIGQEILRDGTKKLAYSDIYSSISSKTVNLIKIILLFIYAFKHQILLFYAVLSLFSINGPDLMLFLILK